MIFTAVQSASTESHSRYPVEESHDHLEIGSGLAEETSQLVERLDHRAAGTARRPCTDVRGSC